MKKRFAWRMADKRALAIVLAAAVLVLVNGAAALLPTSLTQIDLSGADLYTFSDQTKDVLSSLETDVTMYLLAPSGSENDAVMRLLTRYQEASPHIRWESKDPGEDPAFVETYGVDLNSLYTNSVLVVSRYSHTLVGYNKIYVLQTVQDENGETGQSAWFDGENVLTGAVWAVSNTDFPVYDVLTGHGEKELPQEVVSLLEGSQATVRSLALLQAENVPEDCDALIIHVPAGDLSPDEADKIKAYLDKGGKVVLITDYMEPDAFPNLRAVCAHMGMAAGDGLIIEGDANYHVSRYPYYLLPALASHRIVQPIQEAGYRVLLPISQPIVTAAEGSESMVGLLTTSDKAYLKKDGLKTTDLTQQPEDETGAFRVGALAFKGEGRMVWYTSSQLLDSTVNQLISGANYDLFMNTLSFLRDREDLLSIRSKALSYEVLSVPAGVQMRITVMLVAVIPLLVLVPGVAVTVIRRRR